MKNEFVACKNKVYTCEIFGVLACMTIAKICEDIPRRMTLQESHQLSNNIKCTGCPKGVNLWSVAPKSTLEVGMESIHTNTCNMHGNTSARRKWT